MTCLVRVEISRKNTKILGSSLVLTIKELDKLLSQIDGNETFNIDIINDSTDELHKYLDKNKDFIYENVKYLHETNRQNIFDEILKCGNPSDNNGLSLAHGIVKIGYEFTIEQLFQLGNIADDNGETIAHIMANKGYAFTLNEILRLGNPVDNYGYTLSHWMASKGHRFTVGEILELKNPISNNGETIAFCMIMNRYEFTADEEKQLGL